MQRKCVLALSLLMGALIFPACLRNEAPRILDTSVLSDTHDTNGPYRISTIVLDDRKVKEALLYYRAYGQPEFLIVPMVEVGTNLFIGEIPGQPGGTTVMYFVRATDANNKESFDPAYAPIDTYSFTVLKSEKPVADAITGDDISRDISIDGEGKPDALQDVIFHDTGSDTSDGMHDGLHDGFPDVPEDVDDEDVFPFDFWNDIMDIQTDTVCGFLEFVYPLYGVPITTVYDENPLKDGNQVTVEVQSDAFTLIEIGLDDDSNTVRQATTNDKGIARFADYTIPFGEHLLHARLAKDSPLCGKELVVVSVETAPNDTDGDGIKDSDDNCPTVYNPSQTDIDNDNIGEACRKFPSKCLDVCNFDINYPRPGQYLTQYDDTNPTQPGLQYDVIVVLGSSCLSDFEIWLEGVSGSYQKVTIENFTIPDYSIPKGNRILMVRPFAAPGDCYDVVEFSVTY